MERTPLTLWNGTMALTEPTVKNQVVSAQCWTSVCLGHQKQEIPSKNTSSAKVYMKTDQLALLPPCEPLLDLRASQCMNSLQDLTSSKIISADPMKLKWPDLGFCTGYAAPGTHPTSRKPTSGPTAHTAFKAVEPES